MMTWWWGQPYEWSEMLIFDDDHHDEHFMMFLIIIIMMMMVMIVIIVHQFPWWWNEANGHNGKSKTQMADGPQLHVQPSNKYKRISGKSENGPLAKKDSLWISEGKSQPFLITAFGFKPGLVSVLAIRNQCDWDSWQGRQLLNFCMVKQRHSTLMPLVITV